LRNRLRSRNPERNHLVTGSIGFLTRPGEAQEDTLGKENCPSNTIDSFFAGRFFAAGFRL